MLDPLGLIEKHRGTGVLIDANLLLLYLVGRVNRERIKTFKRTQAYTLEDFDLLERLVSCFSRLFTTPHVLTEVSNLAGSLVGRERLAIRRLIALLVDEMEECFDASRAVVRDACFERLGLTDAAIATLCDHGTMVLTADLDLYLALQTRGADALNFSHIRSLGWS
jgi:predicted nucleic acid-binding protein